MASKKETLLESAQRFVLKGQIDRAINDYQQVVTLDPTEMRYRQRLAELLVRQGRQEEAVAQYEEIGRYFAAHSYFLKAIAVYKQMQRLAPGNLEIVLTLAQLNHKQGLTGNALAEYGQVAAAREKQGDLKQALEIVQQMLAIDASNLSARFKYAELLLATGSGDAAYHCCEEILAVLKGRGDTASEQRLVQRMRQMFPQRSGAGQEGAAGAVPQANLPQGVGELQDLIRKEPGNRQLWRLLVEVEAQQGNRPGVQRTCQQMLRLFPEDVELAQLSLGGLLRVGDTEGAVALLQRYLPQFQEAGVDQTVAKILADIPAALQEDPRLRLVLQQLVPWEESAPLAPEAEVGELPLDLDAPEAAELPSLPIHAGPEPAPAVAPVAEIASPDPALPVSLDNEEGPQDWEVEIELDLEEDLAPVDAAVAVAATSGTDETGISLPEADELQELVFPAEFALDRAKPHGPEARTETFPPAAEGRFPDAEREEGLSLPGWEEPEPATAAPAPVVPPEPVEEPAVPAEPGLDERAAADIEPAAIEPAAIEPAAIEPAAIEPAEAGNRLSWRDIFPGVDDATGESDPAELESHYDLGFAYREMGMYREAVRELTIAARNPKRRLSCLTLLALCYREQGDAAKAEELLTQGRDLAGLSPQDEATLAYELAVLYQNLGRTEEALALYREVQARDPEYHDLAQRLALLSGEEPSEVIELEAEEE